MATATKEGGTKAARRNTGAKRKAKQVDESSTSPAAKSEELMLHDTLERANVIVQENGKPSRVVQIGMRPNEAVAFVSAFNRACGDLGIVARVVECDRAKVLALSGVAPDSLFSVVWFKSPADWRPGDLMPDGWQPDGVLVAGVGELTARVICEGGNHYLAKVGCEGRWAAVVREGGAA